MLDTEAPSPPCGMWSVLRRGFYGTAFLRHSVTPKAKVGSSLWPGKLFVSLAEVKIPSDLRAGAQSHFQAALVHGDPHHLGGLLMVFSAEKAGKENTSSPPRADCSSFWCRHPGEAVIQSCSHVTTWALMSSTFVLSIRPLRKGL